MWTMTKELHGFLVILISMHTGGFVSISNGDLLGGPPELYYQGDIQSL